MTTAEPPASGPGEEPRTGISDEEWARFLRESEGPARASAPKEPSARARMVAERLRRLDEEEARRRGGGKRGRRLLRGRKEKPVRWQPDPWRAPPSGRGVNGAPRTSRTSTVIIVLVGFVLTVLLLSWLLGPARY